MAGLHFDISRRKQMQIDEPKLAKEKIRAREQWDSDPCGAVTAGELEFGTREFFDAIERYRYEEYAPWMPTVMGFTDFKGARLLEVGCGMGSDLMQFARGGAKCTGVDLTPRSVEISRDRFRLYGMPGDFSLSDAERLPFGENTFDVYYSNGVLHHTPGTQTAIMEAYRVLKPGGTAKVMLYHRNSWAYWVEMMAKQGLYKGELFRGLRPADILSKYVEYNESGGRPLVKVYSRSEAKELFSEFKDVQIKIEQLTRPEVYLFGKLLPESLFRTMSRTVGWNVIVTAVK
jgi:ubiquinone/menaquinone biosynthesis C-methylase UbiE